MKIGVLGTGMVGNAIASKLVALGHEVMMGSHLRQAELTWPTGGRVGTFAETSAFGELVFNCTQGTGSLAALQAAGAANLDGKIVVDVANVLTPEGPGLESLGEQIQLAFPPASRSSRRSTRLTADLMVAPDKLPGSHRVLSEHDGLSRRTGSATCWVVSVGGCDRSWWLSPRPARQRSYVPLWISLWKQLGTLTFNINVVR